MLRKKKKDTKWQIMKTLKNVTNVLIIFMIFLLNFTQINYENGVALGGWFKFQNHNEGLDYVKLWDEKSLIHFYDSISKMPCCLWQTRKNSTPPPTTHFPPTLLVIVITHTVLWLLSQLSLIPSHNLLLINFFRKKI